MKHTIRIALVLLLAGVMASCNLDKYPHDAIPEDEGFLTYQDATEFRNGVYNLARASVASYSVIPINLQAEGFNPTRDYGNVDGFQYNWTFADNDANIEALWANCYVAISQFAYFLDKCQDLRDLNEERIAAGDDENVMSDEELANLSLFEAEAKFFRALLTHKLTTFFCKDYDPATAATDYGMILVEEYDTNARRERATMKKTYETIMTDINEAEEVIGKMNVSYNPATNRIDIWTVRSLKAKVLLDMHEYEDAATLAASIANHFGLINATNAFRNMWASDSGAEIIFQFFASLNEGRSAYGSNFVYSLTNNPALLNPKYIPTQWLLDQYDEKDIRKAVYFDKKNIEIAATVYNVYVFNKYPGNPAYNTNESVNEYMHNVRLYRSADFYLIAAEAYYMAGNEGEANKYMKQLLEARIPGYEYENKSGEELFAFIKAERLKEMVMEGNRIADLKRWGDPMDRTAQDPQNEDAINTGSQNLRIEATDHRFVWPIPLSEYNNNAAIKKQPNEGWTMH